MYKPTPRTSRKETDRELSRANLGPAANQIGGSFDGDETLWGWGTRPGAPVPQPAERKYSRSAS